MSVTQKIILTVITYVLCSCTGWKEKPAKLGKEMDWQDVPGWEYDSHSEIWPAIRNNCSSKKVKARWGNICAEVATKTSPDDSWVKDFLESRFQPHILYAKGNKKEGLITGYYEPLLYGSHARTEKYQYPIYRQPDDLLIIDLGELYPDLKNKRVRGKLNGNKVIPYYSREQIEQDREILEGNELIWLDNRDDVFFLHIQGSGRIQLDDGTIVGAGYANQNGHPYVSIGKILLDEGELEREEISLFTIRQWLDDHPGSADSLLNRNPSYVFFVLRENTDDGPIGSLNVPLTPQRSIAIDPKLVELGTPIWLMTNYPGNPDEPYQRLVIAQDTGGAIKGTLRADLFWGHGESAEKFAGTMKEKGSLIVLLPKQPE